MRASVGNAEVLTVSKEPSSLRVIEMWCMSGGIAWCRVKFRRSFMNTASGVAEKEESWDFSAAFEVAGTCLSETRE